MLAVCPGATDTEFFETAVENASVGRRRSPKNVVHTTLRALARRRPTVVDGYANAAVATLAARLPQRLVFCVAERSVRPALHSQESGWIEESTCTFSNSLPPQPLPSTVTTPMRSSSSGQNRRLLHSSPLTGAQQGLDALSAREEASFAGFTDLRAKLSVLAGDERMGAMLVCFDATHDGPYAGIPATGRAMALDMTALLTLDDDGKVIRERVFLDTNDLLEMLTAN